MSLTRYGYRNAISGFFEFPTDNARRILPAGLEPVELHHGTSIFSMTVFDFTESEVGAYGEELPGPHRVKRWPARAGGSVTAP